MSRLPSAIGVKTPDASGSLPGEGTKFRTRSPSASQAMADEWLLTRQRRSGLARAKFGKERRLPPPPQPETRGIRSGQSLRFGSATEREAFFEDLKEAKFGGIAEAQGEGCIGSAWKHSHTKNKFCWGIEKKDMVRSASEFPGTKDFGPKKLEEGLHGRRAEKGCSDEDREKRGG